MSSDPPRVTLPQCTFSNPTQESLQSSLDSDIRPLLSPIVSEPGELDNNPSTMNKMLLTPGDDDDDFLLRSLKFASRSNTNLKPQNSRLSLLSSKSSLRMYKDNPTEPTTMSSPYIYHPSGSKIINSTSSFRHTLQDASNPQSSLLHAPSMEGASGAAEVEPNPDLSCSRRSSIAEDIIGEVEYLKDLTIEQLKRRRFFAISIFSIICIFLFDLIFLPRTTLDRDLRRLYGGSLTHDEVSRIYISQLHANPKAETYIKLYDEISHQPGEHHKFVRNFLQSFEYLDVEVEKYNVYMGEPISTKLQLIDAETGEILLEPSLTESHIPAYYPYSKNGTINAEFVYVNYGYPLDYKLLKDSKVNMDGKIYIMRNGGNNNSVHPSLLIRAAQDNGASGIIFYSDPHDDGKYTQKNGYKSFPRGYARNGHAIDQNTGSFIFTQPGDPTTPGWSPYLFDDYKRVENPDTIPQIPIFPVNYKDLEPILSKLNGIGPHFNWEGDLAGCLYNPGPSGKYQLKMVNEIDYGIKPIYNIIIEITGIMADEEIIIGTSRDVIGGAGGISNGEIGLWEIARGFNELVKRGWKPLRTIKLISWDGSSYGQLGSTEYGEYHAQRLINNCVVYINFDKIKGSQLLIESNPLFNNTLRKVMEIVMVNENENETLADLFKMQNNTIELISNTVKDYTIFQNHLGVSSINIGSIANPETDPVPYSNSKYDSVDLLKKFDPDLKIHNLLAQYIGMLTMELSENEIIDVSVSDYADVIHNSFRSISEIIPENWLSKNMTYPFNYKKLRDELEELRILGTRVLELSTRFDSELKELQLQILQDYPWFKLFKKIRTAVKIKLYNIKVKALDKMFISIVDDPKESIMPSRPWYRHLVFAPSTELNPIGHHTHGVIANILPGFQDALSSNNFEQFERNLVALHVTLDRMVETL